VSNNLTSSSATKSARISQRGFITRAARPQRKDGGQPAAALFTPPLVGNPVVPVVIRGKMVRPRQPGAESKSEIDYTFENPPAPSIPKPKRERGLSTREKIELASAKKFLCQAQHAAFEFARRRMLMIMFAAIRQMNFSPFVFSFLMRQNLNQLYKWSRRAKAEGIASLHPWRERAFTKREMELLNL